MKCEWCKENLGPNKNRFCNKSCSAKHTGWHRRKHRSCGRCNKEYTSRGNIFCSRECYTLSKNEKTNEERLEQIASGTNSARAAKMFLLETRNECSICCLKDIWNQKPINLILDHIDGNPANHNISNLRLVCPNCDSQLPTFKSRNMGNGRHNRMKRYHSGQSY